VYPVRWGLRETTKYILLGDDPKNQRTNLMEAALREAAVNIPFFKRLKTYGPRMILDVLEERVVLDASVAPTDKNQQDHQAGSSTNDQLVQQTAVTSTASVSSTPAANQATPPSDPAQQVLNQDLHVVLISNALGQVDAISKAAAADAKVITYDGQNGDIQTIVNELKSLVDSTGHKIEQLELLSYGQRGILQLSENSLFSADTVSSNPIPWQTLGSLLTANAQIDLFGCNIGQGADGTSLVNTISSLTHATVWASNNTTGSGSNSDWVLETHSGESALGSVLDANVLKTLNVTLDNSDMTNPGFETGTFTGWTQTASRSAELAVVNASTGGNYGGINVGPSPLAALGSVWMARIDDNNANNNDSVYAEGATARISQTFTYNTPDHLVFAYNKVTSDGYGGTGSDYTGYDNFGYKVSVTHAGNTTDVVNVLYHSGDVLPNTWQLLRNSGWQTVDIDLSQYAQIGDSIAVQFQCGNTVDNQYDSWMYVDMQKTTPVTKSLYTHGVLDLTVFENTGSASNTVRSLDNIFADNLYPNSQLTLSLTGNTNPDLFSSVSIDPTTHQLTLGYALHACGNAQITIHAVDPAAHTLDYTFDVTVLPVDDDPTVPTSQADTTGLGGAIPVTLTGYDPDLHKVSQVSFTVLTAPTHGTLSSPSAITMDSQGNYSQTYTYTPTDPNYTGDDPFTYKLTTPSGTWKTFTAGTNLSSEANYVQSMELSDVNNSGYPVLVTAATSATNGTGDAANYYYANTAGTFGTPTQLGNDTQASRDVVLGDFNGDGHSDALVINGNNESGKYYLWENPGFAGTQFGTGINASGTGTGAGGSGVIAVGDINGDGSNDFVEGTSGGKLIAFKNLGGQSFDSGATIATGLGNITALAIGDLNNDGYLDIIVGRNGALTQVYQGHANGTFTLAATLPNTSSANPVTYSIALGDVNGDGLLDVVEGNYATTAAGVNKFYQNTGNFSFTEKNISTDQDQTAGIRLADVNHDGNLDVLVSNYGTTGTVYNKCYLFNSGTGQFSSTATNIGGSLLNCFASAAGDVNNDGYTDFVVGQWGNNITTNIVFTNQGLNNIDSNTANVTIHNLGSNLLKNPNFDSYYSHWYFETDNLPPLQGSDLAGTFAIMHPGDTVSLNQSVLDYNSGQSQIQWSWYLPLTIPGTADLNNKLAVQLTDAPHHGWLMQDFNIPNWSSLTNMQLQFDIAYWNHLGQWHAGTQDLAVYVYDVHNTSPQPLWIATQGVDNTVTQDAQGHDIFVHKSFQLPTALLGHKVSLAIEMSSLENFMEYAVDNFQITATFGTATPYNPTLPSAPTLGSVFGPDPTLPPPSHIAGGVLPGMTSMSMVLADAASLTLDSGVTSSSLLLTALDTAGAQTTTPLLATIEGSSYVTLTTTSTSLDTSGSSTQTQTTTTTSAPTAAYSAVTLASPDPVQITPDPAPTAVTTTPDLLALALTPASTTPTQAGLDVPSGTGFASLDKGDSGHDYGFDLKTTLVFDLDDVSALHVLSLNAPVPINPLDLSESAILGERLSAGRSVAVSLDSMRFSDILG
jgi:hypothetical protein